MGPAAIRDDVFDALGERFGSASRKQARAILATARRLGQAALARLLGIVAEKLGDPDAAVRRVAVVVLSDMKAGAATPDVLSRFPSLLRHPLAGVRETAALALEFIGPAAATADIVLCLSRLTHDPDR